MSFEARITRTPLPFDPDRGQEAAAFVPGPTPALAEVLRGTGGSSPYLYGLIGKEAAWLPAALSDPDAALTEALSGLADLSLPEMKPGLRRAKRRIALLTALCDLAGVWELEQVTRALTDLADLSLQAGLRALLEPELTRGKIPGQGVDDLQDAAGMVVLAMGKMGAHELNYSSDIDLICLFDDSRFDSADLGEARAAFIRVTRKLMSLMSEPTGDGYVFRTDLRLRPDPSVTPVCISMEAAERYYESLGRTWERAAHIKARPCAGAVEAGAAYLTRLRPFIWRKHLDFAAIQDAHDMRLRIRDHKGLGGELHLEGHNMKLGKGGIRDIEFFTQTRQIISGGRDPSLRLRGTVEALAALRDKGWVEAEVTTDLTDHYRYHRMVEHRVQMIADAQTHDLPKTDDGFRRLACLMGQGDVAALRHDLFDRLNRTAQLAEPFFAPEQDPSEVAPKSDMDDGTRRIVDGWRSYPALRSQRANEIFDRLLPEILQRLEIAAKPDEALRQFDGFLRGLPAGVQLFSLFDANPQLIDLIVDICATSPLLAQYLSRNASVFDAVIAGQFFSDWPGRDALEGRLAETLALAGDYESKLDAARRWMKEWHFRVGVHHLRGLITPDQAAAQYTDLAQVILSGVFPHVAEDLSVRHGPPPGRGAVLLGMGSLGAGTLTAQSDLDLIVVYDPAGADASDGPRPLTPAAYYAKLTKALVTAMSAPMAEGKLYEVDMRLRPSGRQGPVATSWGAYQSYQRTEAWTWEHLALTRARVVAGAGADHGALAEDVEAFRRDVLASECDAPKVRRDVADMRARLAEAKPASSAYEAKLGAGRLQDIELLGQAGALLAGDPRRRTPDQLQAAVSAGLLGDDDAERITDLYQHLRAFQQSVRLLTDKPLNPEELGLGGCSFIVTQTGRENLSDLAETIETRSEQVARLIDAALADPVDAAS